MTEIPFKSGFAAIVGRPNAGKSTLLNAILGEKIVITSAKPQTTRNRIQGIHNVAGAQIVFIDTPGIHEAKSLLNRSLVESATNAIQGVDLILFMIDASARHSVDDEIVLGLLKTVQVPVILVINKVDAVEKTKLLDLMERYSLLYSFREIVPVSALKNDGLKSLVALVSQYLPAGPAYFPDDILTDLPERFIVAEMIREQIFRLTHDEIPYSVAVEIESFKERPGNGLIAISAVIIVERDSQKGIIIGRRGDMLKRIGTAARLEVEKLLAEKVFLELFVKVSANWSENPKKLKEYGY